MKGKIGFTRHDLLEVIISIYLMRVLFPLPFRFLPSPWESQYLWAVVLLGAFAFFYANAYFSKQLAPVYVFFAIHVSFIPLIWAKSYHVMPGVPDRGVTIESFVKNYFPLFIACLVYFYYVDRRNYEALGRLCRRAWLLAALGTVTLLVILILYPRAMVDSVRAGVMYEGAASRSFLSDMGFLGYGFMNALCSVFPVFIYFILKTNIKLRQKVLWAILASISWYAITKGWVTAFLLFSSLFTLLALIMKDNYMKDIRRLVFVIIIVIMLPVSFKAGIFYQASEYFPDSKIGKRLYDAGQTIEDPDIDYYSSKQHAGARLGRTPILWRSFMSNPLIGGGLNSGHVAWLDMLSIYGLLGFLPWAYLVFKNFNYNVKLISESYSGYYMLCIIAFVSMGFLKATGGAHVFLFWFMIVPGSSFIYNIKPGYSIEHAASVCNAK